MPSISSNKDPYGNIIMLSPAGKILCRCSEKRMRWYLDRELAVKTGESEFQLLFQPSGDEVKNPFYTSAKANKCVVCGKESALTMHHIVPFCYRKHFPDELKNHSSFDVLPLCTCCHKKYETEAFRLKQKLAVPFTKSRAPQDKLPYLKINGYIRTLQTIKDVPEPRRNEMLSFLIKHNVVKTFKDLDTVPLLSAPEQTDPLATQEIVLSHIEKGTLKEFIIFWRNHFLEYMKPENLPEHWLENKTSSF